MRPLAMLLARGQSRGRLLLVLGCTTLTSTLLLVAVALLKLPEELTEGLFELVADPGVRPGLVFALLLLTAPTLLLLWQVIRLGTAARQRRLAVLRLVGATPTQVRVLAAAELGLPALAGAILGYGLYWVLRLLLGGVPSTPTSPTSFDSPLIRLPGLIPTSVGPSGWQVAAVALVVTAITGLIGWRTSTGAVHQPFELARRRIIRRPRPWPLLLLGLALIFSLPAVRQPESLWLLGIIAVAAMGMLLSGPWLAARQGDRATAQAETVAMLLAGGRLQADPYGAGRAAAPIGLIGLVLAGAAFTVSVLMVGDLFNLFFVGALLLVAVAVLIALLLVTLALTAHGVESLGENRRSTASLAAAGTPVSELTASLTCEARLIARPMGTLGLVLGLLGVLLVVLTNGMTSDYAAALLVSVVLAYLLLRLLVALATHLASRLLRPWVVSATSVEALRTE